MSNKENLFEYIVNKPSISSWHSLFKSGDLKGLFFSVGRCREYRLVEPRPICILLFRSVPGPVWQIYQTRAYRRLIQLDERRSYIHPPGRFR
jgi:hypothetical protein